MDNIFAERLWPQVIQIPLRVLPLEAIPVF